MNEHIITYQRPLVHSVHLFKFNFFLIFIFQYANFAGYFLYVRLLQCISLHFFHLAIRSSINTLTCGTVQCCIIKDTYIKSGYIIKLSTLNSFNLLLNSDDRKCLPISAHSNTTEILLATKVLRLSHYLFYFFLSFPFIICCLRIIFSDKYCRSRGDAWFPQCAWSITQHQSGTFRVN